MRLKDRIEQRFGRLIIKEILSHDPPRVRCACDCGNECVVYVSNLLRVTQSCGCLHRESITRHGAYDSPEYKIWQAIVQRCYNPKNKKYADYGGRGILMHPTWREDFVAFLRGVGPRPTGGPRMTIERRDNNRGYVPGNVYWATYSEESESSPKGPSPWLFRKDGSPDRRFNPDSEWSRYQDYLTERAQKVACPACGSGVGIPCRGRDRRWWPRSTHYRRRDTAKAAGFVRGKLIRPLRKP